MGYFNYFIKCVIRKFVNMFFKPKTMFVTLIIIFLLYLFGGTARAEWTEDQILDLQADLFNIAFQLQTQVADLKQVVTNTNNTNNKLDDIINNKIPAITDRLEWINGDIVELQGITENIYNKISSISTQLTTLNTEVLNIYNTLEENQKELITELQTENQKILKELEEIKKILNGSSEEVSNQFLKQDNSFYLYPDPLGVSMTSSVYNSNPGYGRFFQSVHFKDFVTDSDYVFEKGYTYTIYCSEILTENTGSGRFYYTYDRISAGNEIYSYYVGNFTQNNFTFTFTPIKDGVIYFFTENYGPFWSGMCRYTISKVPNGSLSSIGDNLNNVNNSINQGNQLQQEQNNFLKDDNVNTDGLEFATDDTVNPTSDGFDTLFNTIYNAFCNTSSQPLTITLPYINETFTIQPNIVSNAMQKSGLGVVVGLINSFYYFSVCLFIYKDIGKIVDNLKSGNITSDCGNVKTEVL